MMMKTVLPHCPEFRIAVSLVAIYWAPSEGWLCHSEAPNGGMIQLMVGSLPAVAASAKLPVGLIRLLPDELANVFNIFIVPKPFVVFEEFPGLGRALGGDRKSTRL